MFTKFIDHELEVVEGGANLHLTLHTPTRPCAGFRNNMKNAVIHLAQTTNKPVHLRFSGGLDSQVMVRAAMDAGVEFKAHHLTYLYNFEPIAPMDLHQAQTYSKKFGFEVEYVPLHVNKTGVPFDTGLPVHIYNEDHLVLGAGGETFHHNPHHPNPDSEELCEYNDYLCVPREMISRLRIPQNYGTDIYTQLYSESAELFFSMLWHKSLEPIAVFTRDNPERHAQYDLRKMKFILFYEDYGDELIYYDKLTGLEDLPPDVKLRNDAFVARYQDMRKLLFKEADLKRLARGEVKTLHGTMFIPEHLIGSLKVPSFR